MKKILIALVLVVIAAVAAGPYLIGSQIEKTSKQLVQKGNQQLVELIQSNPQIESGSITLDQYDKGYLSSKATSTVSLTMLGFGEPKQFTIPFNTDITHGPYLGEAGLGLARIVSRPDLSGLDLPDAINDDTVIVEGIVDFSQAMTETLTVAPVKYTNEEGNTVDFAGAVINSKSHLQNRATFTADMNVQQLKLGSEEEANILTLKPFEVDIEGDGDSSAQTGNYSVDSSMIEASMGEGVSIVLQKMAMSGNYKKAKGANIYLGDGDLTLTDLVITNPEALDKPLKLPELTFNSKLEQSANNDLSISAIYKGKLDSSMMALMNSPVDVKTAELAVQFKAIPVKVITEYQGLIKDLMSQTDQTKAAETMQAKIFELIQMLANNAASTSINVKANAQEGDLIADIDTGFKPGVNFDAAQMMQLLAAPSPSSIMPLLVGRGNVSLSKGVTDKAGLTPMIQVMAAEFVTLKDDKFIADLQITDGQLLINGTPLPLSPQ